MSEKSAWDKLMERGAAQDKAAAAKRDQEAQERAKVAEHRKASEGYRGKPMSPEAIAEDQDRFYGRKGSRKGIWRGD